MLERAIQRNTVIQSFVAGELTRSEAARALSRSERQVSRMAERFQKKGISGLEHGGFGKKSNHRLTEAVRKRIEELSLGKYLNFNATHFHEKLIEVEKIEVSYSSVKRIVDAQSKRKHVRRCRRKRKYRDRYPTRGLMLQMDGSDHW